MPIQTFSIGPLETNCYLVHTHSSALVIDPGGDPHEVIDTLHKNNLKLLGIYLTHLHFDHLYGVADLQKATTAPVFSPPDDAFLLESEAGKGGVWGFPRVPTFTASPLCVGKHTVDDINFTVMHTPGHTPGSMSLYFPDLTAVFTGDVLFYRAVGRSDLPGGNQDTLMASIQRELFPLPPNTIVYPGHGPASTIGEEKQSNPYCGDFAR